MNESRPFFTQKRERSVSLPSVLKFNQEIAQFSKHKQYEQALKSFSRMINLGIPPDVVTYNTMINVYVKLQRLDDAFRLFKRMIQNKIEPTIVTYTSLIDGCGKCGNFAMALSLYKDVKSKKIQLNMHFFNAIMNAGLLNGISYIIDDVLHDIMIYNMQPNTVTYNTLLSGYLRFDKLTKMIGAVQNMQKSGVEFSSVTQTTILQAVQLVRNEMDLKNFLDLLKSANLVPSQTQASQAILDLIHTKRLLISQRLITAFLNMGCNITEDVYVALVQLAGENANFTVLSWIQETAPYNLQFQYFVAKLDAFARFDMLEEIERLYPSIPSNHHILSVHVKLALMQCFVRTNHLKYFFEMYQFMYDDHQIYEVSINKIFSMLSRSEYHREILTLFNRFRQHSYGHQASDCIITALINMKAKLTKYECLKPTILGLTNLVHYLSIEEVSRVDLTTLIQAILDAPTLTYLHLLLEAFYSKAQKSAVWTAFCHFASIGCDPDSVCLEIAADCIEGYVDLMKLLQIARESNVEISGKLYSRAITECLNAGNVGEAFQIRNEISTTMVTLDQDLEQRYNEEISKTNIDVNQGVDGFKRMWANKKPRTRSSTLPDFEIPQIDEPFTPHSSMFLFFDL